jgi:hypothetical protein
MSRTDLSRNSAPIRAKSRAHHRASVFLGATGVILSVLTLFLPAPGTAQEPDAAATTPAKTRKSKIARQTDPSPSPAPSVADTRSKSGKAGATHETQPSEKASTVRKKGSVPPAVAPVPSPNVAITRYRVTAETTPFFRLGPQQPAGPDLALKKDTRLSLVKRGFGYSQIKLDDGTVGYVGNEDIKLLTPEEAANETTLTLTNTTGPGGSAALFGGAVGPAAVSRRRPRGPALPLPPDAQEPSLPLPDFAPGAPTSKPQPTPAFRLHPDAQ